MPVQITHRVKVVLYICIGFLFVVLTALGISSRITDATITVFYNSPHYQQRPVTPVYYSQLNGQPVELEIEQDLTPFIVMIENHVDSRPVAGIDKASIVYEAIVEGEVTRYMAVFDQNVAVERIGPVRSARPFYVELAEEWDGVYFHAGGSPAGLEKLKTSPMYNINEISGDGIYFWRDTQRFAPHNLYISGENMRRARSAKDIATTTDSFTPWKFKDDADISSTTFNFDTASSIATSVIADFAGHDLYKVEFRYSSSSNDYTRYLGGQLHKTEQGIIVKAKNIIIQKVAARVVDSYGRLAVDVDGSGVGELYQDGIRKDITWEQVGGRTLYFDDDGQEISFNRGVTWVMLEYL